MEKLHELTSMKHKLIEWLKCEMDKGVDCFDAEEGGKVVDMIKDLAEAEKDCWKATYYETVVGAMEEAGEVDRPGYDHYRYKSGRFAPKGHGHYSGYHYPPMANLGDVHPDLMDKMRMGYSITHHGDSGRYGKAYNDYQEARRHYSKTRSSSDKEDMEHHANAHLMDTIATIREIYHNADPDLKRQMKMDCEKLVEEMKD